MGGGGAGDSAAGGTAGARGSASGDHVDSGLFKLRLEGLRNCNVATTATAPVVGKSAAPGAAGGQPAQLGVAVAIEAKIDQFSISPRDLTLEADGLVLRGAFPAKSPIPGCAPLLPIKLLKRGEVGRGLVIFDVPPDFRSEARAVTLAYRPTRWGGTKPATLSLPGVSGELSARAAHGVARAPPALSR
jgi:hypothetical protein